jgi:hypothetical protein
MALGDLHTLEPAQADKLASLYCNILHEEMTSVTKPEPKLVEGIFTGLKHFLQVTLLHHNHHYLTPELLLSNICCRTTVS